MAAIAFLIVHRDNPIIRLRGLWLSIGAVCFLHPYWMIGNLVVPIFPTMNAIFAYDLQFFFMGIWLPVGIGLFQASNLRFLYVAKLQKQYIRPATPRVGHARCTKCNHDLSLWQRFWSMSYSRRMYTFVGIGIAIQIVVTIGTWLACKKYHPTFGVPGTGLKHGTVEEQMWWLNQGWEWWPTIVWQFFWTWILAPVMLIRAWNIEDTLGWRTQTVGCCIAGLHATPMYLVASYVEAFKPINKYWTSSNWIHLSMMIWTILILFVPVFQILRHQRLRQQAVDANAKQSFDSTLTARSVTPTKLSTSISVAEEGLPRIDLTEFDEEKLLTMNAMDHVLRVNPEPLQDFSALRDFSGENIAFLVRASQWKSMSVWSQEVCDEGQRHRAFTKALELYAFFISPRDAQFPLNISGRQLQPLVEVFGEAARKVFGETRKDSAVPEDFHGPSTAEKKDGIHLDVQELSEAILYIGPIPDSFNANIFDDVMAHIRELVFLNTWPKFVKELRRSSVDTQRTEETWASKETLVDRTVGYLKGVLHQRKGSNASQNCPNVPL